MIPLQHHHPGLVLADQQWRVARSLERRRLLEMLVPFGTSTSAATKNRRRSLPIPTLLFGRGVGIGRRRLATAARTGAAG